MNRSSIAVRAGLLGTLPALIVFSLVVNLLLLVQPLYMLQIYDRVLASGSFETLVYLSLIAVVALALLGAVDAIRAMMCTRMAARMDERLGPQALVAAMRAPRAREGDTQPLRDLDTVRGFVSNKLLLALIDLPFAPLFIAILYLIHPDMFWLTLGGAAILAALALANQLATARAGAQASGASLAASATAQSFVRGYESLRAMGMVANALVTWGSAEGRALEAQGRMSSINAGFAGLSRTLRMGLQIAILGYGGYLVLDGQMTAGMIFAASLISGRALQPIDQIIGGWKGFVDAGKARTRLLDALATVEDEREKTALPAPVGRVGAKDVTVFAPGARAGDEPLLNRVSFAVEPGECMVVLGPSGAGKSTLIRAVVGALPLHAGVVRIDGAELSQWRSDTLGGHIGYLGQDVELFPGTIAQNIARFDPKARDEAVVAAAQEAGVHALIQSLPKGYDTLIGPAGMALSGGQRQRIGLARAFYGAPRILVLDEPNASLDADGEAALDAALRGAKARAVTVILVTQRRPVVERADKVLLLRDGAVEEFGGRDEVVARRNAHARTMRAQGTGHAGPRPVETGEGQHVHPSPVAAGA